MPSHLLTRVVSEVASQQALLPVLWLGWLHLKKRDPGAAFWWLSGVFVVSWIADMSALWIDPVMISAVYPLSQAWIVGAVFLPRRDTVLLIVVLGLVGFVSLAWQGVADSNTLLRTVAWGAGVGIVFPLKQLGRLRTALLVTFGLGWLSWMYYLADPGWTSYLTYQSVRLLGILAFCRAAISPLPQLHLSKR